MTTINQNFISCNGNWTTTNNTPVCNGLLQAYTADEILTLSNQSQLTIDQSNQLIEATIMLFALVFIFLLLRKVINS